jgi:CheY-like chemotaxis protein
MNNVIILLVDDNAVQAATRRTILEKSGQRVAVASDGVQALSLLDDPRFQKLLGLVITDHLMPGMNGPQLVKELRSTMPTLPIVVLSGFPDAEEQYGGMEVIFRCKPFPPDALIALSQELLDEPMGRTA